MRSELHEIRRLKKLLATPRLNKPERVAIEERIRELERAESGSSGTTLPGVFGVFDRPAPSADNQSSPSDNGHAAATEDSASASGAIDAEPVSNEDETSPEQVEALADKIVAIADRIVWLRSYWARTLSPEVEREAEVWLARLQALAKELPTEIVEAVLGKNFALVQQAVRDVSKPAIAEKLQRSLLPPSAPSLDVVGTWSELYYAFRQPRAPRPAQHPPGYLPDGLQSLVA